MPEHLKIRKVLVGDTLGVLYGCENKALAGKGICKCMKIMEIKIDMGGKAKRGIRKVEN